MKLQLASLNGIAKSRAFCFLTRLRERYLPWCLLLKSRNHLLQGQQVLHKLLRMLPGERRCGSLGGRSLHMQHNPVIGQNTGTKETCQLVWGTCLLMEMFCWRLMEGFIQPRWKYPTVFSAYLCGRRGEYEKHKVHSPFLITSLFLLRRVPLTTFLVSAACWYLLFCKTLIWEKGIRLHFTDFFFLLFPFCLQGGDTTPVVIFQG